MPIRETMTTHNNIMINRSTTCRLIIVGLWLWTITTVAFQLQYHQQASNSIITSWESMRQKSRLYTSEIDFDDENDDVDVPMMIARGAPEDENEMVFSRGIYERKRGDFDDAGQSYGGKSLASTLVRS